MPFTRSVGAPANGSIEARRPPVIVQDALAVSLGVALLLVLAGLAVPIGAAAWLVSAAVAFAIGFLIKAYQRHWLVLLLIPATLITNSAVVPHNGRYIAAVTVILALLIASHRDLRDLPDRFRALPTWLGRVLVAYMAWMIVSTIFSTSKAVSLAYVVGGIVTITLTFVVIPAMENRHRIVRELIATLVVTSLFIVISGLLLALAGSITLYGKAVGLYFIAEATVLGHPTGLVFLQDYGPFEGPETTPLAVGIAGAIYLAATSTGRARIGWTISGLVLIGGLLVTFSREGWLIAALTCLALAIPRRASPAIVRATLTAGVVMLVLFLLGITNTLGILGRVDLTTEWYGQHAASVLLNPSVTQKGESQPGTTSPAPGPVVQRSLSHPCVAQAASGSTSNSSVELKGFSSLLARLCLWEAAGRAILDRPLFGFGLGTGADAIIPFFYGLGGGVLGATAHDTYLRVGVEMGVPGLLIYLILSAIAAWIALGWLRRGGDSPEMVLAGSVLAITITELTDTLLFGGLSFPGFWLAMAVGLLAAGPLIPARKQAATTMKPSLKRGLISA